MNAYLPSHAQELNYSPNLPTGKRNKSLTAHSYHITGPELFAQINEQGPAAFDQLFQRLYAPLCLLTDRYIDDEEAAKDIVSDLFLNLWNKQNTLMQIDDVPAYLYVAAKYKSLNYIKHNQVIRNHERRLERSLHQNTEKPVEQYIYEAETTRLLYLAITQLPSECRQVVQLSLEGLSTSEIAKQLHITPAAVSNQKARAIRLLKLKIPVSLMAGLLWMVS